jgi:hypothetical protein
LNPAGLDVEDCVGSVALAEDDLPRSQLHFGASAIRGRKNHLRVQHDCRRIPFRLARFARSGSLFVLHRPKRYRGSEGRSSAYNQARVPDSLARETPPSLSMDKLQNMFNFERLPIAPRLIVFTIEHN